MPMKKYEYYKTMNQVEGKTIASIINIYIILQILKIDLHIFEFLN